MKKIVIGLIIICLICSVSCNVFAADKTIWEQATEWMNLGREQQENTNNNYSGFEELAGVITGLGIWIILITGMVIGIKFMVSSPEKKAELKKALMVYVVGSVIIMGALGIWKVVISLFDIF